MDQASGSRNVEESPAGGVDVGEMRAYPDDNVATARRSIGVARASAADAAERKPMFFRKSALTGGGGRDRNTGRVGEAQKLVACMGIMNAATDHNHRSLSSGEQLGRFGNPGGVRRRRMHLLVW